MTPSTQEIAIASKTEHRLAATLGVPADACAASSAAATATASAAVTAAATAAAASAATSAAATAAAASAATSAAATAAAASAAATAAAASAAATAAASAATHHGGGGVADVVLGEDAVTACVAAGAEAGVALGTGEETQRCGVDGGGM